jgi:hypothetical protein
MMGINKYEGLVNNINSDQAKDETGARLPANPDCSQPAPSLNFTSDGEGLAIN